MKTKFWNRLLIAFCGLVTLAFGIGLFTYGAGFFPFHWDLSRLDLPFEPWQRVIIIVIALGLVAVGIYGVCVLFRRGKEKGFIIQRTEYGDMSISMNALQNMVKKCVQTHSELTAGVTRITRSRDGVVVNIKVMLNGGANIPLTVNALQKQIKQYITSCSGVDVKEVRVMVETNVNKLEAPAQVTEAEAAGEEQHANSIFTHTEEPGAYAGGKPEQVAQTAAEPQAAAPAQDSEAARTSETERGEDSTHTEADARQSEDEAREPDDAETNQADPLPDADK